MSNETNSEKPIHWAAKMHAQEVFDGKLDRREFLTRATALGVTSAAAYGMIGLAAPAKAEGSAKMGGTLRVQMEVHGLTEPRLYQWSEMGNMTRGWLEHLIHYNNDGTFSPVLAESWETSDDAKTITIHLRKGVTWNNGEPFTSADVVHNFNLWCDGNVEGNSMATRMGPLVDPDTKVAIEGGIVAADEHTVVLNLPYADITILAGIADYPAAITHPSLDSGNPIDNPIGTGPYLPDSYNVGEKAVMVRNENHTWWNEGNGAYLDRIEFIDYGTDPATIMSAVESEEVDMTYESIGDFIDILSGLGMNQSEASTAATIITRPNQLAEVDGKMPYADVRVRRALAMAVDNAVVLELGYAGRGSPAENHHVSPIHPEYAELPAQKVDPAGAMALMKEAGMADFDHEIISLDDGFEKDTTDAVAAQLRDAGFKVTRKILPGSTFWNDWAKYPFSSTTWNQRPFGVQVLALAYKTGVPWNETGFANEEFDSTLVEASSIADADQRRVLMKRLEEIMQNEGVIIQPYWRSVYNHSRPGLVNADMHAQFEIRYQNIGWDA
ncbi:ABC transporter substrate-binding protein [Parasedimentitalea marina]|uniref:ABC transporter substrate-binding protein n=1 Tax=Parasedimentitalea marina TaxID=2483033 RepID=A0A3T0N2U2_9RHOB|nr:ABC transporter substrate-binding protein [Parasedimentitalea marina]AZV78353.1 ABC transporter substrate-binding protein [Parasedimentitalea marina]